MITNKTPPEKFTELFDIIEELSDGQYLVNWAGSFTWTWGDEDIVSDYLGETSPHLVDFIGSCKSNPFRNYCKGMEKARFIQLKEGTYNFYTVEFFYKDNG